MKKYIFIIAFAAIQLSLCGQTVNVHFKNGQVINYNASNVDYVDFSTKAPDPTLTPGQVIDLGLSVYWASCNLGAESPEEYGNYYAWGETESKMIYELDNYSYYDKDKEEYINIGYDISGTEYDAATVNLGNDWRMPTKYEMEELVNKCSWEWTQIGDINGYIVTGTTGNSIFLPACGIIGSSFTSYLNESLYYSSSTRKNDKSYYGYNSSFNRVSGLAKFRGASIRPVTTNLDAGVELRYFH